MRGRFPRRQSYDTAPKFSENVLGKYAGKYAPSIYRLFFSFCQMNLPVPKDK